MQTLEYPHVVKNGTEPARLERVHTRVAMIVTDYLGGWSADKILEEYDYLRPGEVYAALGYYFDHREEIDAELAAEKAEIERSRKLEGSDMAALRARLCAALGSAQ